MNSIRINLGMMTGVLITLGFLWIKEIITEKSAKLQQEKKDE